ncbi:hypothetical protein LRS05_10370 [Flavobacterium sp. J372]|uniref:hypothetical protein n=1 Tax=Flavobacterium sp. J372 TaxID=2898436 RepID=UPI0021516FB3|nr:hypothetical protein [Flavobacterium sp. J372]MCR5862527.1 hypothetical protein [Flavobacterium sp. J372]
MKKLSKICLLAILGLLSCNDDDSGTPAPNEPVQLTENVEVYNGALIDDSYALAIELGQKKCICSTSRARKNANGILTSIPVMMLSFWITGN